MRKIRVLIVDDSVVVRRLVTDVLASEPTVEVVGTASTGQIALAKIPQINPDVVTLDVEMPVMDGLTTLREIRKIYPRLPVIMFSTLTERGAAATIDALALGANDYVTKPANVGSVSAGMEQVRHALLPKIRALCPSLGGPDVAAVAAKPMANAIAGTRVIPMPSAPRGGNVDIRVDLLAIACSTGGPNALAVLLPELPKNFPVPIVIVQHMPPMFTRMLAEHLSKKSQITVSEAVDGEPLRPGHALVAPGDYHLALVRRGAAIVTQLHRGPPENSCRPAADVLFRSVAELYPGHALGVVLTGMGHDGQRGSEHICATGGRIIVQDEASSVVWGMAGSVAHAGHADGIWPIGELGQVINRRIISGRPGWQAHILAPALGAV
jgi:two-component system, chemotaxis family, protein-glutamate methylesterase/glutaminase